jgi:RimJ/RimL family protein N-acetyltransferase
VIAAPEPIFLQGNAIVLTPLGETDLCEAYLAWLNDADVLRYRIAKTFPTTLSSLKKWIEEISSRGDLVLAIRKRSTRRHVGNIALNSIWWGHRSAELAIMIGAKDVWGRGYGTEAISLLTDHAFSTMGLHRIWAQSPNPAFNASVRKLGWKREGTQRKAFLLDGRFIDIECWGVLVSEWKKRNERLT